MLFLPLTLRRARVLPVCAEPVASIRALSGGRAVGSWRWTPMSRARPCGIGRASRARRRGAAGGLAGARRRLAWPATQP